MQRLKRYFISGLVVIVPVVLTLYVLALIFKFADNLLGRFLNVYLKQLLGFYIPGLSVLIALLAIILVGVFATHFFGRKFFSRIERWFSSLPLIRNIYPAFKQIILFISAQKEFGFKKVVLVEYPSKDIWSIGFLTNEEYQKISKATGRGMVSVFMPSSPGPLTGYVIFVPKEALKFPDLSVSDALNIIISGGVFRPKD